MHSDPIRLARLREAERLLKAARTLAEIAGPSANRAHALWWSMFADEAETVQRAANNLLYAEALSDSNLAIAADMGERIAALIEVES